MRTMQILGLFAGLAFAGGILALESRTATDAHAAPIEKAKRNVDLKLDEKSAVQIAEIVLVKVYGNRVLDEKPWHVATDDASFTIEGTLPKEMVGGVGLIRISRKNAEVLEITHGK